MTCRHIPKKLFHEENMTRRELLLQNKFIFILRHHPQSPHSHDFLLSTVPNWSQKSISLYKNIIKSTCLMLSMHILVQSYFNISFLYLFVIWKEQKTRHLLEINTYKNRKAVNTWILFIWFIWFVDLQARRTNLVNILGVYGILIWFISLWVM